MFTFEVRRLYPLDSSSFGDGSEKEEELRETMREAVERHWKGIEFRERNAGSGIDEQMRDRGEEEWFVFLLMMCFGYYFNLGGFDSLSRSVIKVRRMNWARCMWGSRWA